MESEKQDKEGEEAKEMCDFRQNTTDPTGELWDVSYASEFVPD